MERSAGSIHDHRIHRPTEKLILLSRRECRDAERTDLVAPGGVRFQREHRGAALAQAAEHVRPDVTAPDQPDGRALDGNVHPAQHAGQDVEVALAGWLRRVRHDAALEPRVEVCERSSEAVRHHAVPEVLARGEVDAGARFDIVKARDREVEQLAVARLSHARVGRRVQHTLAPDDAIRIAQGERPSDAQQPRPVDLLLHADREPDGFAVAVEPGGRGALVRCDAKATERQLAGARRGKGCDAQPPAGTGISVAVDPDASRATRGQFRKQRRRLGRRERHRCGDTHRGGHGRHVRSWVG